MYDGWPHKPELRQIRTETKCKPHMLRGLLPSQPQFFFPQSFFQCPFHRACVGPGCEGQCSISQQSHHPRRTGLRPCLLQVTQEAVAVTRLGAMMGFESQAVLFTHSSTSHAQITPCVKSGTPSPHMEGTPKASLPWS